jgi:hypothetical protein
MFGRGFVTGIIDPASSGNPAATANSITGAGYLMLHDVAAFNAAFATIPPAIGLGLLWQPAVKAALAGTIGWGLAAWLRSCRDGDDGHARHCSQVGPECFAADAWGQAHRALPFSPEG